MISHVSSSSAAFIAAAVATCRAISSKPPLRNSRSNNKASSSESSMIKARNNFWLIRLYDPCSLIYNCSCRSCTGSHPCLHLLTSLMEYDRRLCAARPNVDSMHQIHPRRALEELSNGSGSAPDSLKGAEQV